MLRGCTTLSANVLECIDRRKALNNLTKDNVVAIEPWSWLERDEELGAVRVWAGVCHREDIRLRVVQVEVLIVKLKAVDALSAFAVTCGEISTLSHEVWDDPVEGAALVPELVAIDGGDTVVLSKLDKVFDSPGDDVTEKPEDNAIHWHTIDGDIKVDLVSHGSNGVSNFSGRSGDAQ